MRIKDVARAKGSAPLDDINGDIPNVIKDMVKLQFKSGALDRIISGKNYKSAIASQHTNHEHDYDTDGPGHLDNGKVNP